MLAKLADGHADKAVADLLDISTSTLKARLRRLYDRLGVNNRVAAVAWFVQQPKHPTEDDARWYWRKFVKGEFAEATERWLNSPDHPDEVRLCMACMLLLESYPDQAQREWQKLDAVSAKMFSLLRDWLRTGISLQAVEYIYALPPSQLRHAGLLAIHYTAGQLDDWQVSAKASAELARAFDKEMSKRY